MGFFGSARMGQTLHHGITKRAGQPWRWPSTALYNFASLFALLFRRGFRINGEEFELHWWSY